MFMRPWLQERVTQLRPSPSIRLLMHLDGSTHAFACRGGGEALIPMWVHVRRHTQDFQEHAWKGGGKTNDVHLAGT